MDGGQNILADHALIEHDGILVVVALPRHVGHKQVAAQGQFAVLRGITFGQDVAGLHALSLLADGAQVDRHVLVRAAELRNLVFLGGGLEANELFLFRTVVRNADGGSVDILYDTFALGGDHGAGILAHLLLDAGADDRRFGTDERNGLAHHVRAHQGAVGVVVFQERNQRGGDRGNLLRRHVHQFHLRRRHNRIVRILAALHLVANEGTVVAQRGVALADNLAFLLFGRKVDHVVVV